MMAATIKDEVIADPEKSVNTINLADRDASIV
jgi:hypothetical protein